MSREWDTVIAAQAREAEQGRAQRKARGVVHTPRELAAWALSRVQRALVEDLQLSQGLAHARVSVLDPAVGTGVWLEAALSHVPEQSGATRRWLAFDVDDAALDTTRRLLAGACAARNVELVLSAQNTLELASPWPDNTAVRVLVGNPPWATRSLSRGMALSDAWLRDFMRDGRGEPLGEKRMGVLSDDYVRFFRWALEQARTATAGAVVCLATNSSFLDGPVHRGMRARLLETFDRIEVLDLGGNALLSQRGERDESVFGVRVGAALTLLVRRPGDGARRQTAVTYGRVSGSSSQKLESLGAGTFHASRAHVPEGEQLRFIPLARGARTLDAGFSLAAAFPFHREGLQTNRDALAIASTREALEARVLDIVQERIVLEPSRHFSPELARARLAHALTHDRASAIVPIAYRPLVSRFACVVAPLCHRPRLELAQAMQRSTMALACVRKDRGHAPFNLFAPTRTHADSCFLSSRSSCRTRLFPSHAPDGSENLGHEVRDQLSARVGREVHAHEALAYALGVLAAESFREQAGEALKHDYPRVPWPRDAQAFEAIVRAGEGLDAALHDDVAPCVHVHPPVAHPETFASGELSLVPSAASVAWRGHALITGVHARAFATELGHYPLIASALKVERVWSLTDLVRMLSRASLWVHALTVAEHAFMTQQVS